MTLLKLMELLPKPKEGLVRVLEDKEWQDVELTIGTQLPSDYKLYVNTYGDGVCADFIIVCTPFCSMPDFNILQLKGHFNETMRLLEKTDPDFYGQHRIFAELDTLLPWGKTTNADYLLWRTTQESPDNWKVSVLDGRSDGYEEYDMDFSNFMYNYLLGNFLESKILVPPSANGDQFLSSFIGTSTMKS